MKASNIILISFFSLVVLIITTGALYQRINGVYIENIENDYASAPNHKTIPLPGFKHIKIMKSKRFTVEISDTNKFELHLFNDKYPDINYRLSGDTLIITNMPSLGKIGRIRLYANQHVQSITCIDANIKFTALRLNKLSIKLINSNVDDNDMYESGNRIRLLSVNANYRSILRFNAIFVDTLRFELNKSRMQLSQPVGLIQGELKDSSQFGCRKVSELSLKSDTASKIIGSNYYALKRIKEK